ncbi:hypothetical protein E2C01_063210 [Portunus trituberculatus]|uniref:Uncharacterized protein n=1 Tax=Portunus trituberculatus TaxID=210409 RepID=A0A5B7HIC5_PORTR|nr:hypothetical protein [Portunus trituberculatus]
MDVWRACSPDQFSMQVWVIWRNTEEWIGMGPSCPIHGQPPPFVPHPAPLGKATSRSGTRLESLLEGISKPPLESPITKSVGSANTRHLFLGGQIAHVPQMLRYAANASLATPRGPNTSAMAHSGGK